MPNETGVQEALARFGIKTAAGNPIVNKAMGVGQGVLRTFFGSPDVAWKQGLKGSFGKGGILNPKELLWPSPPAAGSRALADATGMKLTQAIGPHAAGTRINDTVSKSLQGLGHSNVQVAPHWSQKINPYMGRAFGTVLPAWGVLQAARGKSGDPNESRLTNTLGALGSAAGAAVGFPLGGMFGAPIIARAGHALGTGVGHMFSPRQQPPQLPQAPMPPQMPPPHARADFSQAAPYDNPYTMYG